MDLNLKAIEAKELINSNFTTHAKRIYHHGKDNPFDFTYFYNFYRVELMKKIQEIFKLSDDEFDKLMQVPYFQREILQKIDAAILQLANLAVDARLYTPKPPHRPKP
ncbi:hypothetical protein [uncultured Ferrimonas sp.]|uniref:hypothetical protein n=1 Tax=uncultured Ferrimonas sp. TaxID=432640 RepID=UPI00260170F1|nr:hypothetical protein [uncultured Ferrimonas sp.]